MAIQFNQMVYPRGIRSPSVVVTGANSTFSGTAVPANLVFLAAVGPNGSYLRKLYALPNAPNSATQVQLFKWNGSNLYFVRRAVMPTYGSVAAAVECDFALTETYNLFLGPETPNWVWYVGIDTALAAGITVSGEIEDL